jgi:hypothetical protein
MQVVSQRLLTSSDGPSVNLCLSCVLKISSTNFSSQRIAHTTPPSTLNAAPLVAEECSLATKVAIAATSPL